MFGGIGKLYLLRVTDWYFYFWQTYAETRGHNFALNATFDEIDADNYNGLVLPGGRAPEYLALNESVLELVRKFTGSGKPIASICHGQLILAAADAVKGRKCTAYPPVKPVLMAAGAHWVEPETMAACVIDGNIITGATYEGHPEFIRLFVKALGGTITGVSGQKILFLCGVSSYLIWMNRLGENNLLLCSLDGFIRWLQKLLSLSIFVSSHMMMALSFLFLGAVIFLTISLITFSIPP